MSKSSKKTSQISVSSTRIKRETWKTGYQSVARNSKGHFIATTKWHSSKDTEHIRSKLEEKRVEYRASREVRGAPRERKKGGIWRYFVLIHFENEQIRGGVTIGRYYDPSNESDRRELNAKIRSEYSYYDWEIRRLEVKSVVRAV
jgi:hypothetical protein